MLDEYVKKCAVCLYPWIDQRKTRLHNAWVKDMNELFQQDDE